MTRAVTYSSTADVGMRRARPIDTDGRWPELINLYTLVRLRPRRSATSGIRSKSASGLARQLEVEFPGQETPSERTIRAWVPSWNKDGSGRWSLALAQPDDSTAIVRLLPQLASALGPAAFRLTNAQAQLLARLSL